MEYMFYGRKRTAIPLFRKVVVLTVLIAVAAAFGGAIDPIPEEEGFSGRISVGAAWFRVKSNMVAGSSFADFSSDRIDSEFGEPDSETGLMPIFGGELRYTFESARTQAFIGSGLTDRLRFDISQAAGIRQQYDDLGILEGAFLFSFSPTRVWEDPYLTGAKRDDTDRSSVGARLTWSGIYNSNFHCSYSCRTIDIDDELSGTGLGLSVAERNLLDREGDHHRAEILYKHQLCENQWIAPAIYYNRYGLDGDAMSHDLYSVLLTHTFATRTWRLVTNLSYGVADHDKRNPIYGKTQDDDRYGVSTMLLVPNFLDKENLTGIFGAAYLRADSNIDFYDTEVIAVTASTMYTF